MTREEALQILDTIPTISEQVDALEMAIQALSQEPCERFEWGIDGNVYKITKAKDGKEICQQVCDDAISLEAVIEWLKDKDIIKLSSQEETARKELKALPPVTQKSDNKYRKEAKRWKNKWLKTQKSGKWIKKEYWKPLPYDTEPLDYDNYDEKTHSEKIYIYCCSECGQAKGEIKPTDKFCPNCGAKMESEEQTE